MEKISNLNITEYDEGDSHYFQTDGAMAEVELVGEELILHGITVSPENQGQGVGSKLLKAVEEYARMKKCKKILGDIADNEVDGDPIGFYTRHSYTVNNGEFFKEIQTPEPNTTY